MKANELMIGDWVLCDRNAQSDYEFDNVDYQPYQIANGEDIDYAFERNMIGDADVYQPIPLTKEILEKNGFTIVEVGDNGPSTPPKNRNRFEKWFCQTTWQDIYVWYDRLMKEWCLHGINQVHFNSVHMLQHAFRLYGITKEIEL